LKCNAKALSWLRKEIGFVVFKTLFQYLTRYGISDTKVTLTCHKVSEVLAFEAGKMFGRVK
jgi:hypothetical protein